jgi:hypothetical protein
MALRERIYTYKLLIYIHILFIRESYIPPKISLSKQSQRAFWAEEFDGISTKMVIFLCFWAILFFDLKTVLQKD